MRVVTQEQKARSKEYHRAYYLAHREKYGYDAARYAALSLESRQARAHRHTIKYMFKMSVDQYATLLASQGGRCAVCGDEPKVSLVNGRRRLHVDHDHACCPGKGRTCGKCIRGLLCDNCNFGRGSFKDDPVRLRKAIKYLTQRES